MGAIFLTNMFLFPLKLHLLAAIAHKSEPCGLSPQGRKKQVLPSTNDQFYIKKSGFLVLFS